MAPRRTARQILLDGMSEAQLQREVIQAVVDRRGRFMHVRPATVRQGRVATPTSCAWPDLAIWFPDAGEPDPVTVSREALRSMLVEYNPAEPIEVDVWLQLHAVTAARFHLVELKAYGEGLRRDQPEVFASLEHAGMPVAVWQPRDLDDIIPDTLDQWSGRTWH